MMARFIATLLFFFTAAWASADDIYVSFVGLSTVNTLPYILKINEAGQVLKNPVAVPTGSLNKHYFASLTNGGSGRLIIVGGRGSNQSASSVDYISSIVDKNSLQALGIRNLGIAITSNTYPASIQVTQNTPSKFAVLETTTDSARAFGLTDSGALNGTKWRLDAGLPPAIVLQVGVAADGRMSFQANSASNRHKIYLQPLTKSGLPVGNAAGAIVPEEVNALDLSNPLPNGNRLLVYKTFDFSNPKQTVFMQRVSGETGRRLTSPVVVSKDPVSFLVQGVAVDPKGRFLLYVAPGSCGGREVIYYQALDALGNLSGKRVEIVGCKSVPATVENLSFLDILLD